MGSKGVLLVNLGSPDTPTTKDVRRYLAEFLSDPLVIDAPWIIRMLLLYLVILPKRPKESAHAYQQIWTEEGSPLVLTTYELQKAVAELVDVPIEVAMRYGSPSIEEAVAKLKAAGVKEVFALPLYPHFAMSSYETVVKRTQEVIAAQGGMTLQVQSPFYDDDDYVASLVEVAKPYLDEGYDHLLFSYHGLPTRHMPVRDATGLYCQKAPDCCERHNPVHGVCYRAQIIKTTRLFVEKAGLKGKWSLAFQSRLTREPWLLPSTEDELPRLAKAGVKKILVICPAFVADCLETLEEIAMRGEEIFIEAGGESLTLIPCLNVHPSWVRTVARFVTDEFERPEITCL